jgi:acetylglutamate kinase
MINQHGGRAVGLSGKDGTLMRARKMEAGAAADDDIGLVGVVEKVDAGVIETLDRGGFIPVIAPVGVDAAGNTYNINADLVAANVAAALKAEKLVLLTDVEGIRGAEGTVLASVDAKTARDLIARDVISGGMIPKVECCLDALAGGVHKTHIVDGRVRHALLLEIFTSEGVGTQVVGRA